MLNNNFNCECEIYNFKELKEKYNLKVKSESELLFNLLEKNSFNILDEIDGVYAFAYFKNGKVILGRDILGIKPVFYSYNDGFHFDFERKNLEKKYLYIKELNPREILIYENNKIRFVKRDFFEVKEEVKSKEEIIKDLKNLFEDAVKKRISDERAALLFSGGVDSSLIALLLKKLNCKFICYTCILDDKNLKEAKDLIFAGKVAKELNLDLKIIKIKLDDVEKYLKEIIPIIESCDVVKVGVALPLYIACTKIKEKIVFSGLGSEEIFAGYERHKVNDVNKECLNGLKKMYERDLYRDYCIVKSNGLKLKVPFLDKELVGYTLKIDGKYKIKNEIKKYILRETALNLGLKEEFAFRKKRAAQYGSNFHKALKKLSKKNGFLKISDYLKGFYRDIKLGALISSGKDSLYAMYIMHEIGFKVSCLISIKSENKDSFMFHSPVELVKKQSELMDIPLVMASSKGVEEEELDDLKEALVKAREMYNIGGVICGGLYSNYQKKRLEKVCDSLNLKLFSPLWHVNLEAYMRDLIKDFEVIITKVSADGLNESCLGEKIDDKMIDRLIELNKKNGINIAGEGGEYESLVLNCPLFKKKLVVKGEKKMEKENVGFYKIKKVSLV